MRCDFCRTPFAQGVLLQSTVQLRLECYEDRQLNHDDGMIEDTFDEWLSEAEVEEDEDDDMSETGEETSAEPEPEPEVDEPDPEPPSKRARREDA